MTSQSLTDLIIFNSTLRHDSTDAPPRRLSLVDKEDWDEVSQVLFTGGSGSKDARGDTEWNVVLKQMGLAKGLMGFVNMIEAQSFPEPEEDTFQIIHSKRRVTCIYQIEQDHLLIAVYALPVPPNPETKTSNKHGDAHTSTAVAPRSAVITDEQYKTSLRRACDRYLVENGSLRRALDGRGREDVEAALTTFWNDWIEASGRPARETSTGSMRSLTSAGVDTTTGVDPATTTIKTMWDAWIDERDDLEAVFISPQDPLGQRGNIFDDEPLRDYLASKLEQTMPRTSRSSESHARTHSVEGKHSHSESGTWKKLGISSWGSSIGLGSGESVSADQTKGTAGSSNSNLNTNSTKWGGIGQWFGIGSGTPPTRSSHQETSRQKSGDTRVETDTGLGGTDRVDLASLHSALETEAGGQEDGDRPDWTIEEVWVDRGTERVTLAYVIRDGRALAIALRGHDTSNMRNLLSTLPPTRPLFDQAQSQTNRSAQFGEGAGGEEDEVTLHNPLRLQVRQTKTAGRGVFAPEDIPAGTVLEESPVLVLTQAEWEQGKLNDGILGGYAFNWSNGGMAVGLGIASMFNHSPKPNVNFIRRAPTSKTPDVSPGMVFMTSRPISKGEELFICYGQESKLWFSPDYGKDEAETEQGYEEEMAESAEALFSGLAGMMESETADELQSQPRDERTLEGPTEDTTDVPDIVAKAMHESPSDPPADDLFGGLGFVEDEAAEDRKDEEKRVRKSEKKALQDDKTAKYQQKKATRKASKTPATAKTVVQLAPPPSPSEPIQTETSTYQAALNRLDLAPSITLSPEDVAEIKDDETGKEEFEDEFGFMGWRLVKRVQGLSEGGEPALDATLRIWAADLPPQLIGKLSQYIRNRNLVEDELSHLRRIYKNLSAGQTLIALYLTSKMSKLEVQEDLAEYDAGLSDLTLVELTVPARAAHSMKEVEHLRSLWPVALRQRPVLASNLPWSAHRKAWVRNGMRMVLELASQNKAKGELPMAVYAASPPAEALLHEPDAIPPTPDIRAFGLDTRKAAGHPLRHATISCVTEIARLRTVSPFADIQATRNGAGYLLTSLSVFMTHQPCVMCVMALVHSRVKEVFYLSAAGGSSNGGGFGGSYPVHSHSGLNHQMDLFDCSGLVPSAAIDAIRIVELIDL